MPPIQYHIVSSDVIGSTIWQRARRKVGKNDRNRLPSIFNIPIERIFRQNIFLTPLDSFGDKKIVENLLPVDY